MLGWAGSYRTEKDWVAIHVEMLAGAAEDRRGQRTELWGTPSLESKRQAREERRGEKSTKHLFNMISHVSQVSETK